MTLLTFVEAHAEFADHVAFSSSILTTLIGTTAQLPNMLPFMKLYQAVGQAILGSGHAAMKLSAHHFIRKRFHGHQ